MAYRDDVQRVFRGDGGLFGGTEIYLRDRYYLVVAGHKGVLSLSQEEVAVRLFRGRLVVNGEGLRVSKVSPSEVYIEGKIQSFSFPQEGAR